MLIKWNGTNQHSIAGLVTLLPGWNEVGDKLWNGQKDKPGLKEQSGVIRLIDSGMLETGKKADGPVNDTTQTAFAGVEFDIASADPAEAKRMVGLTYRRELLQQWAGQAKDGEVKGAIEQQLKAIGLTEEEAQSAMKKKRGG
jgi:hypothetical protein